MTTLPLYSNRGFQPEDGGSMVLRSVDIPFYLFTFTRDERAKVSPFRCERQWSM